MKEVALEGLRLALVMLCAFAIYLVFVGFAAAIECKERPEGGSYWSWRQIDGRRCWYRGEHGVVSKSQLHWSEEKPKRIKGDPLFNQLHADTGLDGVTWYQRRPFDEAAPLKPPPVLLPEVQEECCWPDLSQFDQRWVGLQ
jgi:hypothetical protein